MMNNKLFRSRVSRRLLPAILFSLALVSVTANAQLYVVNSIADPTGSTIGSYTLGGATIDADLVTVPGNEHVLQGLAISGNTLFTSDSGAGTITAYNAFTGAAMGGFTTITGLSSPLALAVSGSSIYVLSFSELDSFGMVSQYTTSGTLVNASLISGIEAPGGLTVANGNIYVSNLGDELVPGSGSISKFTLAGAVVNSSFVTGLDSPIGMTLTNGNLFVANSSTGTIGSYSATSGAAVNASLITDLNQPWGMTSYGDTIYFTYTTDLGVGKIGSFNLTSSTLNTNLVSGLGGPTGLVAVPEPHEWSLLCVAIVVLAVLRRVQTRRRALARIPISR
jgi:hypothetical protein